MYAAGPAKLGRVSSRARPPAQAAPPSPPAPLGPPSAAPFPAPRHRSLLGGRDAAAGAAAGPGPGGAGRGARAASRRVRPGGAARRTGGAAGPGGGGPAAVPRAPGWAGSPGPGPGAERRADAPFPLPQEEAEEYARLSPEEQQRRLRAIVRKIDADADGLLTKGNGGRPGDRGGCVPRGRASGTRGALTGRGPAFVRVPGLARCPQRRKR